MLINKTQKTNQATSLSCYSQQSSIHYTIGLLYIHSCTHWYNTQTKLRQTSKGIGSDMQKYQSHDNTFLCTTMTVWNLLTTRKSSGDEIANVNFLYDEIVHVLHNTIDSCINSASSTDRRGYVLERIQWNNAI